MSFKTLIAHGTFAAVALVVAWLLAHRVEEKQGGPSSVVLLDVKAGQVQQLSYSWPKGKASVTPSDSADDRRAIVEVERTIDPKKPDKKKPDNKKPESNNTDPKEAASDAGTSAPASDGGLATEVEPAPVREQARFPGAKQVITAITALEPLKTRRTLGEVDASRLQEMGLAQPERTLLIVTKGGGRLTLEIGEASYGGQGRYARKQGDATVHLIDSAIVTGLEGGPDALMEKRIVTAEPDKVVGFEVRHGDKSGAFVQVDRSQSAKRFFAPRDDLTSKSEEAAAVMKTLRDLRATKIAADQLSGGSAVAAFTVEIADSDKLTIELLERVDAAGHLVKVGEWLFEISQTQGKELVGDLDRLFP